MKPRQFSLGLCLLISAACGPGPDSASARRGSETSPRLAGCQDYIELKSAGFWALELGQPEATVLATHRINLWDSPEKSRQTGKLIPGSRAIVLEVRGEHYRVQSPLDKSVGWVNAIQVERTLRQDATTRAPC